MDPVLFVTSMRLGDSLHVLPIASWYAKTYNCKVAWAVDWQYGAPQLIDVLRAQPFISDVSGFEYQRVKEPSWTGYSCCRPFHRVQDRLPISSKYDRRYAFGYDMDEYVSQRIGWFTQHFADEHGLGIDYDFTLQYGAPDYTYKDSVVKIDKFYEPQLNDIDAVPLTETNNIVANLRLAAGAKDVITTRTGACVMLTLARIPFKLKYFGGGGWDWYFRLVHTINGGVTRI